MHDVIVGRQREQISLTTPVIICKVLHVTSSCCHSVKAYTTREISQLLIVYEHTSILSSKFALRLKLYYTLLMKANDKRVFSTRIAPGYSWLPISLYLHGPIHFSQHRFPSLVNINGIFCSIPTAKLTDTMLSLLHWMETGGKQCMQEKRPVH